MSRIPGFSTRDFLQSFSRFQNQIPISGTFGILQLGFFWDFFGIFSRFSNPDTDPCDLGINRIFPSNRDPEKKLNTKPTLVIRIIFKESKSETHLFSD